VKRLEDLSLTQRVLLAISIIVAVLLALLIISRLVGEDAQAQPQAPAQCLVSSEERERIREILQEGIDIGLRDQISHLFDVWMRDYTDKNSRAATGARNAINAHISARAHALAWNPPLCREKPK
jgi:hypothetical protein